MSPDKTKGFDSASAVSKHPCVTCQRRKVKCDRKDPCTRCLKAGQVCTQPDAHRPPRRPRRVEEAHVLERLRLLEETLLQMKKSSSSSQSSRDHRLVENGAPQRGSEEKEILEDSVGRLIIDDEKTRYISGSSWANLSDEIGDLRNLLEDDERGIEDEVSSKRTSSHYLYDGIFPSKGVPLKPSFSQSGLAFLWQMYLRNIDPTMKVFHAPTMQPIIDDVLFHVSQVSKETSCLLAAIKFAAVTSMTDEQSWAALGASRESMLELFRCEVQATLAAANFLGTHDLTTLQAYVIFTFCNRRHEQPRAMWIASGIAIRLAQSIGLHRDGAAMNLPVLATEVRRRLFWELRMLDLACAEDCGFLPTYIYGADTRLPLNVNDADINMNTVTPPPEREGITDLTYSLIRYEMCNRYHRLYHQDGKSSIGIMQGDIDGFPDQAKVLAECRAVIGSKHLQHCSPSIPMQKAILWLGQIILLKQNLLAQYPLFHSSCRSMPISISLRDELFETSCKVLELSNEIISDPETTAWTWMLQTYVHWHPVVFLLNELCMTPLHAQAARAWSAIEAELASSHGLSPEAKQALWRPLRHLHERARLAKVASSPRSYFNSLSTLSTASDINYDMPSSAPFEVPPQQQNLPTFLTESSLPVADNTFMTSDLRTPFATITDFMPLGSDFQYDADAWWINNETKMPDATNHSL